MSRMYIVNHWSDAAAYSGEQIGDRLKDSSVLHFNRDGSANVELYSEETAQAKKKTSISIEDRIVPQAKRIRTLTEQLIELEAARKDGMDINKYSKLRDILICKRERAEQLYQKAASVKPTSASSTVGDDHTPIASNSYQIPVQNTGNEVKLAGHSAKAIKDDNKLFFGGILVCFVVWVVVKSFM